MFRTWHIKALDENYPKVSIGEETRQGSNLVEDYFFLSNRTETTLTDDDFVGDVVLCRKRGSFIYSIALVELNKDSFAELKDTEEGIKISNLRVPRGSSLTIQILHDDALSGELAATTKTLRNPKRKYFFYPDEFLVFVPPLAAFIFSVSAASILNIDFWSVTYSVLFSALVAVLFAVVSGNSPDSKPSDFILSRLLSLLISRTDAEAIFSKKHLGTMEQNASYYPIELEDTNPSIRRQAELQTSTGTTP
jgi:hypothetical protein